MTRYTGRLVVTIVWDGLRPDFVTHVTPTCSGSPPAAVVRGEPLRLSLRDARQCHRAGHRLLPRTAPASPETASTSWGSTRPVPIRIANTGDHTHLARIAAIDAPLVHVPWVAQAVTEAGGAMVVASSDRPAPRCPEPPAGRHHRQPRPAAPAGRGTRAADVWPAAARSLPETARSDWMTRGLLEYLLPDVIRRRAGWQAGPGALVAHRPRPYRPFPRPRRTRYRALAARKRPSPGGADGPVGRARAD